jgi:hypothetical protein
MTIHSFSSIVIAVRNICQEGFLVVYCDVNVSGVLMRRTYKGVMESADLTEMTKELEIAVNKFTRKRKKK